MKYGYFGSNGYEIKEMSDEEWDRIKGKRHKAVNVLPWKEAFIEYSDGVKRLTPYKIYAGKVYLRPMTSVTMNEYKDLCIKVREWDDEKKAELRKAEELESKKRRPEYIENLIDKTFLYRDGKRVINSLDDVAVALKDFINKNAKDNYEVISQKEIKFSWQFLQETFLQPNYEKYSEKACRDAVRMANYS